MGLSFDDRMRIREARSADRLAKLPHHPRFRGEREVRPKCEAWSNEGDRPCPNAAQAGSSYCGVHRRWERS